MDTHLHDFVNNVLQYSVMEVYSQKVKQNIRNFYLLYMRRSYIVEYGDAG